jgi:hypothetical protein
VSEDCSNPGAGGDKDNNGHQLAMERGDGDDVGDMTQGNDRDVNALSNKVQSMTSI